MRCGAEAKAVVRSKSPGNPGLFRFSNYPGLTFAFSILGAKARAMLQPGELLLRLAPTHPAKEIPKT